MNELSLFAGAGGGILGGILLGWRTVCAVEIDSYCQRVLLARQNDGSLPPFPVYDDVRTFVGEPWRGTVDIVTGGFPCQDISAAGKGAGITGERSGLWREMARIIREVEPRYVLVENSPLLTSRGLGVVLGDLAALGFDAEWGVLGADDAGAPHRRERIWIVAYPDSGNAERGQGERSRVWTEKESQGADDIACGSSKGFSHVADSECPERWPNDETRGCHCEGEDGKGQTAGRPRECGKNVADSDKAGLSQFQGGGKNAERTGQRTAGGTGWWQSFSGMGRNSNGVAKKLDGSDFDGRGRV